MATDHPERVDEAIAEYLLQCESGNTPDQETFLAKYPELAESLREFFDDHHRMKRAVEPQPNAAAVSSAADTVGFSPGSPADTVGLAAPPVSTPGRVQYFGDYELLGEIARGGMGVVFKARQVSLNREVALKMILAGHLSSPADVQRFRIEAEAAANLDHPNILPIYEVGEHQGQQYFSMKLVPGGSLASRPDLTRNPRVVVAILTRVCRAVHFAHQRGILHRDLKPANILLDSDGTPYVTDFGLAKKVGGEDSGLTRTGAVVGTPSYMAPEQARADRQLTTAADVYSLGAILYELLTGHPPFRAPTVLDTILAVIGKDPEHPTRLNPHADRDLAVISLKCLEKSPGKRYESAATLADDLDRWANGEPILARPAGHAERAQKWVRRNKTLAGAIAGITLALAVGTALATWQAIVANREAERAGNAERAAELRAEGEANARKEASQKAEDERKAKLQVQDEKRRTEMELTRAEKMLYANKLAAAQRAWEENRVERAFAELDACRWDYRGWEHKLLYNRFTAGYATLGRHTMAVEKAHFSPDGTKVASAGLDGVRVWDAKTGRELHTLKHPGGALGTCFSPDGKWIVTAGLGKVIRICDANTGTEVRSLVAETQVNCVAFSPDGKQFAACGLGARVRIWETGTWMESLLLQQHAYGLDFSPDGTRIVLANTDSNARVYDTKTGRELHRVWLKFSTHAVSYSPDGSKFAAAGGILQNTLVKICDASTGQELHSLTGLRQEPRNICFSPDGTQLATVGGTPHATDEVRLWDVATGREVMTLRGHTDKVNHVRFSPDGTKLVTASDDHTVRIWDARSGQDVRAVTLDPLREDGAIGGIATSADGTLVAAGLSEGRIRVWETASGRERAMFRLTEGSSQALSLDPSAARLATASYYSVFVWDLSKSKPLFQISTGNSIVRAVCFSPDGTKLLTGSGFSGSGGELKLWDSATGKPLGTLAGHPSPILSASFNRNGTRILSASEGTYRRGNSVLNGPGEIKLWDAASGKELFTCKGHTGGIGGAYLTPDERRIVSAGDDGTVRFWDAETGQELAVLRGHSFGVRSVCCTPDGTRIVSGAGDYGGPGEIKVWDAETGYELLTLRGHGAWVTDLRLTPDGLRLISAASGTRKLPELWIWDTDAGTKSLRLSGERRRLTGVAFSADGTRLLARIHAGPILTWNLQTGRLVEDTVPDANPTTTEATSPDGKWLARVEDVTFVQVEPKPAPVLSLSRVLSNRLTRWSEPDVAWHTERATRAERQQLWFVAAFHYRQLATITRLTDGPRSAASLAKANDFAARHVAERPRPMLPPRRPELGP